MGRSALVSEDLRRDLSVQGAVWSGGGRASGLKAVAGTHADVMQLHGGDSVILFSLKGAINRVCGVRDGKSPVI